MFPYQITQDTIVIQIDGAPVTLYKDEPQFSDVRTAIKEKRWGDIRNLIKPPVIRELQSSIKDSLVKIVDGEVVFEGHVINTASARKILSLTDEGFDATPMVNFLKREQQNPSFTARQELYEFLVANGFMIDEEGYIIAYKVVRNDYLDKHSRSMDNSVGETIVEKGGREAVDPNRHNVCSRGLHFGGFDYVVQNFGSNVGQVGGDRLMVLRVDPADVVTIPPDYNQQKGRAWRYTVIDEIQGDPKKLLKSTFRKSEFRSQNVPDIDENLDEDFDEDFDEEDDFHDNAHWDVHDDGDDDDDGDDEDDNLPSALAAADDVDADLRDEMLEALRQCDWVIGGSMGAAALTNTAETTFRDRMKRLGIQRPR